MKEKLEKLCRNLPLSLSKPSEDFTYGTAGYRGPSDKLLQALTRASLLAMIRSSTFCGKIIGVMITASHNKNTDNGIKIIDHSGDYIEKTLEDYCDEIVNCKDLFKTLSKIHRKIGNLREIGNASEPIVAIGRDTRESGEYFVNEIVNILENVGCKIINYGIVTTPELHFYVRSSNFLNRILEKGEYVNYLFNNYTKLLQFTKNEEFEICVDSANGVGGILINEIAKKLENKNIFIINHCKEISDIKKLSKLQKNEGFYPDFKFLNDGCGADFIVTNLQIPKNLSKDTVLSRCASFDGDADRLVYFSNNNGFRLVNGDRTAVFLAVILYDLVKNFNIKIGVVLSHYSNTAAINSIKGKIEVLISDTGVKNFIKLSRTFDIGIFFEPNGHGSVTFSEKMLQIIEKEKNSENEEIMRNANILFYMSKIFDPCVGDAIANFLILESLFTNNSLDQMMDLYKEMPTRMLSVKIKSKSIFKMKSDVEIIEPEDLKNEIKKLCVKFGGRSFVRPSGTEDLVRIFAEAEKKEDCDRLCINVAQAVYNVCEGIGRHPEIKY